MHNIHKSAIVLHPAKKMFELVDSVENYPQFLPWCGSTQIIDRDNNKTIASIEINFKGLDKPSPQKILKSKIKK